MLIKAQPLRLLLAMTTVLVSLRVCLRSHAALLLFQRDPPSTSAVFTTVPSTLHNYVCADAKVQADKMRDPLAILFTPSEQMWFIR
jgi:hypothetical protein